MVYPPDHMLPFENNNILMTFPLMRTHYLLIKYAECPGDCGAGPEEKMRKRSST